MCSKKIALPYAMVIYKKAKAKKLKIRHTENLLKIIGRFATLSADKNDKKGIIIMFKEELKAEN